MLARAAGHGRFADDRGQTVGIYIVAMSALFFLAFAYFAVGQAAVTRSSAQTAADAAALAAARQDRDAVRQAFLDALHHGDLTALGHLLSVLEPDDGLPCTAARTYAEDNGAGVGDCRRTQNDPPGYTVWVHTNGTVGSSVVDGTENIHARATATAVVEPRCVLGDKSGHAIGFTCAGRLLTVDPTAASFTLNLSDFYSVHLTN